MNGPTKIFFLYQYDYLTPRKKILIVIMKNYNSAIETIFPIKPIESKRYGFEGREADKAV